MTKTKGTIRWLACIALAAATAVLGMASSASAAEKEHHPTGNFARFEQCQTENPKSILCNVAEATGGELQVGNINIPITKLVLQGAIGEFNEATGNNEFVPAADGESLVRSPQVVTGGLFGLVKGGHYPGYLRNFCKNFPSNFECRVTATPELVGPVAVSVGNLIGEQGTAVEMLLRLHLNNPFLGYKCYIGSASDPVTLKYTTGSMAPLGVEPEVKGKFGHLEGIEEGEILVDLENEQVENAFSVPGAEGCGGPQSLIVDREIDYKQGLPSPAGHNRSLLIGTLYLASTEATLKSEE